MYHLKGTTVIHLVSLLFRYICRQRSSSLPEQRTNGIMKTSRHTHKSGIKVCGGLKQGEAIIQRRKIEAFLRKPFHPPSENGKIMF